MLKPPCDDICVCWQAGLRSELEIATDEMEKAQQRLAALEREKEVLQAAASPTAAQAAARATPNKLVEDSLRNELQNQVCPQENFKQKTCKTLCNVVVGLYMWSGGEW